MATTRINAVSATATTFAGDDFLPIDGNVNATRRLLLTSLFASPSAIGSVTPAAGTFTSLSGTNINGTLGATTPSTGAFSTLTGSSLNIGSAPNANSRAWALQGFGYINGASGNGIEWRNSTTGNSSYITNETGDKISFNGVGGIVVLQGGAAITGTLSATGNVTSTTGVFESVTGTGVRLSAPNNTSATIGVDGGNQLVVNGYSPVTISTGLAVTGTLSTTSDISITGGNKTIYTTTGFLQVGTTAAYNTKILVNNSMIGDFSSTGLAITGTLSATGQISTSATGNALNISTAGATALYQNIGNSAGNIELGAITTGEAYVASGGNKDLRFYRYGSLMASITSTGLAVTGTFTSTVADAGIGARFAGATGKFYLQPYYDATEGARMFSLNAAESGYLPLSFIGSTVRIAPSASLVGLFSSTGLAVTGELSATGNLSTTGDLRVTDTGSSHFILIGNQDSGGANKPNIIRGVNGTLSLGYGTSWSSSGGGTMTSIADISSTGLAVTGTLSSSNTFSTFNNSTQELWRSVWDGGNTGGISSPSGRGLYLTTSGTASTQGIFINGSGAVLLGTTSQVNAGLISLAFDTGTYCGIATKPTNNANYDAARFFNSSTTQIGSISCTTSATAYNTSSDYRLKSNVQDLTGSGAFIDALKPRTFDWETGDKGVGFLAHEFAKVSPSSVTGEKDAVDADGKPVYQSMQASSSEVIANLVAELQSLRKRLAALESK